MDITNKELIQTAASIINPWKSGECTSGDVGAALISEKGQLFKGGCIDVPCGMGFCAEHTAIAAMVTAGEQRIKKIVATWKNKKGRVHILHPCGRCREFMKQVNVNNLNTIILLSHTKGVKLKALLPYHEDFSPVTR